MVVNFSCWNPTHYYGKTLSFLIYVIYIYCTIIFLKININLNIASTEMDKSVINTCITFFCDTKRLEWYITSTLVYTPPHYIRMKPFYQHDGDTLKSRSPQYDYRYVDCITGVCTTK